jgi:hypothetical protein
MASIPDWRGPYVGAATFCEKVLHDNDGVLSAIRLVDRLTVSAQGFDLPAEMPPTATNLYLLVMLKSAEARGSYTLKIRPEAPSGEQLASVETAVHLEGDDRGINLVTDMRGFVVNQAGLWWFDVIFGDNETLLSRVPLRVIYQPTRLAAGATGTSG